MKRQTRRTVSMKGLTYQRFRKGCGANGLAMSAVVETMLTEFMDSMGWPEETVLDQKGGGRETRTTRAGRGRVWTLDLLKARRHDHTSRKSTVPRLRGR